MYYAAANGLVEAFKKTLSNLLKIVLFKSKRDQRERATPYFLAFGVEAFLPLERQIPSLRVVIQEGLIEQENSQLCLSELEALDEKILKLNEILNATKLIYLMLLIKRFV